MSLKSIYDQCVPSSLKMAVNKLRHPRMNARNRLFKELFAAVSQGEVQATTAELRGKYWMDVRSHLFRRIAVSGVYEPELASFLEKECGSADFVDVGANVGFFSIHLALLPTWQGTVLAVEPNPRAFRFLQKNIDENEVAQRVLPAQVAASNVSKTLELTTFEGREEYSTVTGEAHPSVRGLVPETFSVSAMPLDKLIRDHQVRPGLIKIDAEGAELDVLRGMIETAKEFKPTLVCEIGASTFGTDVESIQRQFDEMGYDLFAFDGTRTQLNPSVGSEIVARPRER